MTGSTPVTARSRPWWDGPPPVGVRSLLVVAPHPDDEVLGCGGLLRWAVAEGLPVRLLAVTDGEASHRSSRRVTREALVARRAAEREVALRRLGVADVVTVDRLGLPDGEVGDHEDSLAGAIGARLGADDVVVAPLVDDGHPDHEAAGRAAATAAAAGGARAWGVAIWAKVHRPDTLGTSHHLHLDPATQLAKARAAAAYRSQVVSLGPDPLDGPVVHPWELARMLAGPEALVAP